MGAVVQMSSSAHLLVQVTLATKNVLSRSETILEMFFNSSHNGVDHM